jgi:xanthine dehydrogenase small subunit
LILEVLPAMERWNLLIASWPVRTRSTLGGNIGNASPIADMTCLLLALQSELVLRQGEQSRTMFLKDLFLGYKKLALMPGEWIEKIRFPKPSPGTLTNWEKVSKRAWLDIATVNSAISLEMEGETIRAAHLAVGGVAATPLFLAKSSAWLNGKPVTVDTLTALLELADTEYAPISDVRGSAEYKRLLARQLISAHFAMLFPEIFHEEALDAALR